LYNLIPRNLIIMMGVSVANQYKLMVKEIKNY
jgi:hypothetical protein